MDYYHSLYDENRKTFLKSKIADFAVEQNFVTEFTSLVVVQSDQPRNRRGAQKVAKPLPNLNVQIKKKRSHEKKDQIQAYFQQYNQAKEHTIESLVSQSEDSVAIEDTAGISDENSSMKNIPLNNFMIGDTAEQRYHSRKSLVYILISILALKLFTSRRGRSFIRLK